MTALKQTDGMIIWKFDFALSTFYEIETDAIEHLLPRRLVPQEVAPGISLISLIALHFPEGALGHLPEFQELILGVNIASDLSRGVPKYSMLVLSLGSTCQEHLDHCVRYYKLPIYGMFSKVHLQHDPPEAAYEDNDGPIASLKSIQNQPAYGEGERYFQAFVEEAGELYVADVLMRGSIYEHQQPGDAGRLYSHPFFRGIDVENTEPVAFMQMIHKPGLIGEQLYPHPEKFT